MSKLDGMELITKDNVRLLFDSFGVGHHLMGVPHTAYNQACPFRESEDGCQSSCLLKGITGVSGERVGSSLCPMWRITKGLMDSHKMYAPISMFGMSDVKDL